MNNKIKPVILIIISILLLSLPAGCGRGAKQTDQGKSANTSIPEKDKGYVVQLGYYDCDHMTGACIAKDAGIFDELGLKVNVTGNGKVPEAMAAGQMDAGYVGNTRMMRAFLQGAPIIVGANNHLGGSVYLIASNDIKTPQEVVGKKLSIGTDPEKNNSTWIRWASELGLPVEGKNYEVFNMADKDEYFAMCAGKLDAFQACDPFGSLAEHEKTGHVLGVSGKLPSGEWGICCAYNLNKNFVAEHPELAKLMVLAHTKAIEHMYLKPVRSAEIFAENYKMPLEVSLMTIWKKTVAEGRTITWKIDKDYWQRQIDLELGYKTINAAPNVNEFIQPQYLEECGANDFDTFIKEKVDPVFPVGMSYEEWKTKAYSLEDKKV